MDRNEVMDIIREAGWAGIYTQWTDPTTKESLTVPVTWEQIERAFELAVAREREACAKVCDERATRANLDYYRSDESAKAEYYEAEECAAAIRARASQSKG